MSSYEYPPEMGERRVDIPLPEEEAAHRRALWLKRAVIALGVIIVALILMIVLITVIALRIGQHDNTESLEEARSAAAAAKRATDRIEDCTTPGRKCFSDSQRRTAEVVGNLNEVAVVAAACASREPAEAEDPIERALRIENCVRQVLVKRAEARENE